MYTRYSNAPCLFSWIWLLRLAQVLCGFKIFTSSLVLHLIWNKETRKTWHLVGYKVLIFMVQDSFALYTMSKLNRPILLGYYSLHVFIVASYYTYYLSKKKIVASYYTNKKKKITVNYCSILPRWRMISKTLSVQSKIWDNLFFFT